METDSDLNGDSIPVHFATFDECDNTRLNVDIVMNIQAQWLVGWDLGSGSRLGGG